jgi:hypothetical protein
MRRRSGILKPLASANANAWGIALIVNIALGDAVSAQIGGGKTVR